MPLTYQERIALLAKAREAKKTKSKTGKTAEPVVAFEPEEDEPVVPDALPTKPKAVRKSRAKPVEAKRTLELPAIPEPVPEFDSEPEVVEQIVFRPKAPKKKKIIRRKVIMEASSDTEEEEEIVEEVVKAPRKPKVIKDVVPVTPVTPDVPKTSPFFNF